MAILCALEFCKPASAQNAAEPPAGQESEAARPAPPESDNSTALNRTLTLLDNQRVVGALNIGVTDAGAFPQALVKRVEIVTGGDPTRSAAR